MASDGSAPKPPKSAKVFDFSKYPTSHIAFKIAYHGQDHDGLAKQITTTNTIETIFCEALKKVRLIPESCEAPAKFSRCGRTDKGVSALGNAFSLIVRSSGDNDKSPLDYVKMINNVLPTTVRVVGWCPVPDDFDARFSCISRNYRYYFDHQSLNLNEMRKACGYLVGRHNFRNFCKLDVTNVSNFVREVRVAEIVTPPGSGVSYLSIEANGFLYHQIRCTMSVLFLVGQGMEQADVVQTLLERGDAKPCYPLADEVPLVLWNCEFEAGVVQWRISDAARASLLGQLQDISSALLVRSVAAKEMRTQLELWYPPELHSDEGVSASWERPTGYDWTKHGAARRSNGRTSSGGYVKLLDRPVEMTYAERVASLSMAKRARFEENDAKRKQENPSTIADGDEEE
jgi:tRNA pseudouridine38/39 synthase